MGITQNNQRKEIITQALLEYRTAKGMMSYEQIANTIGGISAALINQVLNTNWDNISDKMWNKLAAFLKVDNQWQLLETGNYVLVTEVCQEAKDSSRFFGIIADSGFGKTTALQKFAKQQNVFYVLTNILMSGKRNFLATIQRALGINHGATYADMLDAIVNRLSTIEKPLLILDDGGKMNDTNFRILQLIYDRTEGSCGIILAGTEFLKYNLERSITRNKMGYEEIFRRIEWWFRLDAPQTEEVVDFCKFNGFDVLFEGEKFSGKDKEIAIYIAQRSKNFGTMKNLIVHARRLRERGKLSIESLANVR